MESVEFVHSVCSDQKSSPLLKGLRQIGEQLQRALVGPVKIVYRYHDRRSSRQICEGLGERSETSIAQVGVSERFALSLGRRNDIRYATQRIDEWPERPPRLCLDALPVKYLGT